jgi:DNA-binding LacI/PurR family transcriptional regulator
MSRDERVPRVITADDVAALAGVSRSAVSRTFTPGASVAPATRDKVLAASEHLGYRVNPLARGLSRQRTNLVGLVVADIDNSLRANLLDGLARGLVAAGYRPFVLPTNRGADTRVLIDMMLDYAVSGAIVTDDASPGEIARECERHQLPLVLINKPPVEARVAHVTFDAAGAGRLQAEAFAAAGCRRVALAVQRRSSYSIGQRLAAFAAEAAARGIEIGPSFTGAIPDYAGGREAAAAFLAARPDVDGVLCANDYLALGFLDHLRHVGGVAIPGDLKVVACDDIPEAGWMSYDLTTVRQDRAAIADSAIGALCQLIDDPAGAIGPSVIPATLVTRSSAAPTSPDR